MKSIWIVVASLLVSWNALADSAAKPNIIVFLVDDMGVMDTSVPMLTDEQGKPKRYPLNDWYRTPGMERLAANGIRFSQFYAQSVCSPTRASILTGQNATRHRTTTWIRPEGNNRGENGPREWNWTGLKKGDVTLPLALQGAGYRTIFVGKAHFGPLESEGANPENLGFDVNIAGDCWGRPKSYYAADHYGNHPKYKKKTHQVPHLDKYYDTDTFLTEALTLEAKAEIRKSVAEKKPFFLDLSHYAVHSPFHSDPRFAANYKDSDKSGAAQAYATLIEGIDKSLNDILDELEALGVAENTLVIFLGDNGGDAPLGGGHAVACAAPLRGKKGTHYEGGMRIPFIAAWAKVNGVNPWQQKLPIAANKIQSQMGTILDIYPTLLELAGVENPAGHVIDGSSLKPLLTGKRDASREEMFLMHFPHQHRSSYFTSFRLNNWKVVYHYNPKTPPKPRYELFHLVRDPFEQDDLSKKNPQRLAAMVRAMAAQLEKEGALYPESKDGMPMKPIVPETEGAGYACGMIADCQYCNVEGPGRRQYALSKTKLSECVAELNKMDLAYVIHLGDLIDRDFESFDVVNPIFNRLKATKYHVLGNHDFLVADHLKKEVPGKMGMPARYYDFEVEGWRHVVLDGNDISFHAYPESSAETKAAAEYYESNEIESPRWNGAIGAGQLSWLRDVLERAQLNHEKVILFCHFPVYPPNAHNLWNAEELIALLESYPCVKAYFNGHNHNGNYGVKDGIHYVTLKGMVDTTTNSFAVVTVADDRIDITGYGREEDRSLPVHHEPVPLCGR